MVKQHPLDLLMANLGNNFADTKHDDMVMTSDGRPALEITPDAFMPINVTRSPTKTAFVDGGNGTIAESPNFTISLNRLYGGAFAGSRRIATLLDSRIEFFSLIRRYVDNIIDRPKLAYDVSLFPHYTSHRRYLPGELDVQNSIRNTQSGADPRMPSLARSLGEWRMAHCMVQTLGDGDILVMDGSLTTLDKIESQYAQAMYAEAKKRGVVVCALAKTSRLLTRSGEPLLDRVRQISMATDHQRWYVEVAPQMSSHDQGHVMAVKLHPHAAFPFRFEILREQFECMTHEQKNQVLSSLATNSEDISFLGYPYGLVDADRYAQVRRADISMYKALLESHLYANEDLAGIVHMLRAYGAHDHLNGVTS